MINLKKIISLTNQNEDYILDKRRSIHQNPELSFQEENTSKLVIRELYNLGLEVEEGIAGTGIVATLQGKGEGKTVLLRAEMDALPISEEADVFFKSSKPGVMHACGHDVHTANLLGVAKILASLKEEFDGTVKFMFQPGEEKGGGCKKMLEDKVLERHPVDMAMALHIMPIKAGEILISAGNITAYSDGFLIEVYGKSAHSSRPEEGIDAINIAAHIVVGLNSIISRKIDPRDTATLSVGTVEGGSSKFFVDEKYIKLCTRTMVLGALELLEVKGF